MSFEVPTLRVNHPEAVAALSKAQGLLIEKFEDVRGSDIQLPSGPGIEGVRVYATDQGLPTIANQGVGYNKVEAELWIPNPNVPHLAANYTVVRNKIITTGNIRATITTEQSHQLLIHIGSRSDITGAISARTTKKSLAKLFDDSTGNRQEKAKKDQVEKFVRNAEEIDVFLRKALQKITSG